MKQTEKSAVKIFCRDFTQAFYLISGSMVVIDPDLLSYQIEKDQHAGKGQFPKRDQEEVIAWDHMDVNDQLNR
jgi:hypothetical protein